MPYKDPEKIKQYNKEYHLKNRTKLLSNMRKYQSDNKQRLKEYRVNNPEINLKAKVKQLTKLGEVFDMNDKMFKMALNSWSKSVRKRDGNICQTCGKKSNIAHHIKHKSKYPQLALDINNGTSLCNKCHKKEHGYKP